MSRSRASLAIRSLGAIFGARAVPLDPLALLPHCGRFYEEGSTTDTLDTTDTLHTTDALDTADALDTTDTSDALEGSSTAAAVAAAAAGGGAVGGGGVGGGGGGGGGGDPVADLLFVYDVAHRFRSGTVYSVSTVLP
jgi:hypothetical protein